MLLWLGSAPASAQVRNDIVPDTWQGDVLRPKPDMHGLEKLRFVTDSDYPPFHYFDEVGALTGFNVDLAKAICESLEVECEIKDVDWSEMYGSLDRGEADAAIASIRISAEALEKADFTSRYYATPARFIALKTSDIKDISPEELEGKKVGVAKGTGHEAYLKLFFPDVAIASFDTAEDAQKEKDAAKATTTTGTTTGAATGAKAPGAPKGPGAPKPAAPKPGAPPPPAAPKAPAAP